MIGLSGTVGLEFFPDFPEFSELLSISGGTFGQHALIADRLRGQNPLKVVRAVTVEKTVLLRLEVPLFNNYLSALDRARSTELKKLGQVWRNSVQPSSIRHVRRHGGFRGWVGVRPVDIAAQHRCRVGPVRLRRYPVGLALNNS